MPRRLPTAALVLGLLAPCAAQAVPWFPSESGPTFSYPGGAVSIWGSDAAGAFGRGSCWAFWPFQCRSDAFTLDAGGDIRFQSVGSSSAAMPDPDVTVFDPPLLYLDFPLETDKTWVSQAEVRRDGQDPLTVTLTGRVVGPATVTVPAGTFEVIIVELSCAGPEGLPLLPIGELWLHDKLGPVNDLLSWTGVVGIGPISWGTLKVMYR